MPEDGAEAGAEDRDAGQRIVDDVDAVRALASPHRVAILSFLLSGPARTATECAAEVGGSPSACSYHLRELERFGLVERVAPSGDGRSRPWRAAAVGHRNRQGRAVAGGSPTLPPCGAAPNGPCKP